MKTLCILALGLLISATRSWGVTVDLDVTPEPNTTYDIRADLQISDVLGFLASLDLGDGIRLVDGDGSVLEEITGSDLAELLDGLTGAVTEPVELIFSTTDVVPDDINLEIPDSPLLSPINITATQAPNPDAKPTVRITKRKASTKRALLRGIATDDHGIREVVVNVRGQGSFTAQGTEHWKRRIRMKGAKTVVRVNAIDTAGQSSASKRSVLRAPR